LDIVNLEARLAALESLLPSGNIGHDKTGIVNLVYLGRLHPIKGLDMQIKLLADLREVGINAHLHLIGPDDGATDSIMNLAVKLGVSPFLHLLGAIYNDERLHWLKKADVVLLTSHYECNSNSAAETMAVGGVLVATDTCHVDRPAQLGAVCVVPREQTQLFDAVRELIIIPEKAQAIRQAARNYVMRYLDWTVHAREMLEFYDKLIHAA
jgi:glycosyltransferase involved in cell wall biosynthesis